MPQDVGNHNASLTYHPSDGRIRTSIHTGEYVQYVDQFGKSKTGTVLYMNDGYNRRGDACFKVRVKWDDGTASTVCDYQLNRLAPPLRDAPGPSHE